MKNESVAVVFPVQRRVEYEGASRPEQVYMQLPEAAAGPFDLSVILPLYNVEEYVEQSVGSLLAQDDIRYQLIFVDDGSTDSSLAVVMGFLEAHPELPAIVIQQENQGLSAARNIGMRFALGRYVAFLDTDDFMAANAYWACVRFALERKLDIVIFRSFILDSAQGFFADFYDAKTWDTLLQGEQRRVTCCVESPSLLSLEPNANTRVVRRDLIERSGVRFPEGLHFEDQPAQVALLMSARSIGLLGVPLYCYRVNRAGKITDQRSRRRFDMLESFSLAVAAAIARSATPSEGAQLMKGLLRISYWCGTMTSLHDRLEYFTELCVRYADVPGDWLDRFQIEQRQDLESLLTLWAIRRNKPHFLRRMSFGQKPVIELLLFFISERRLAALAFQGLRFLQRRIPSATATNQGHPG
jgi:glycosyltransferase involved in cell wall biosynthesis